MSYYKNFRIVIGTPLWRFYLRWAYQKCLNDFQYLEFKPDFSAKNFTCLLCGVGNETTADEFIKFVIHKNSHSKIYIIDLGVEQINAVKNLVKTKYPKLNILVKQLNALNLQDFIKVNSLDWIETDGFLEYFDHQSLGKLISVWQTILKPNGFITLRDFSSNNSFLDRSLDSFRLWVTKVWLGGNLFVHTTKELDQVFHQNKFSYFSGPTPCPTFKRFSLVKC